MILRILGVTIKSILLILGIALGLGLSIVGMFIIGIPIIVLCIWLFIRMIKKERQITKAQQAEKGIEPIHIAKNSAQNESNRNKPITESSQQRIRSNPVADAAASYVIGKAIIDHAKPSALARNPNTERYKAAQEKANQTRQEKLNSSRQQKTKVTLANGRGAYLYTMSNGDQQLVDLGGRTIARYDHNYNRTTEGTENLGKGNLLSTLLK